MHRSLAIVAVGWLAAAALLTLAPGGALRADEPPPDRLSPAEQAAAARQASLAEHQRAVAPILARHCGACHGDQEPEGQLDLGRLEPDMKGSPSAARWAMVLDKLATGAMPPADQPRLGDDELRAVMQWIHAEMKRAGKHVARREAYANGNVLSHELLFGASPAAPLDAPTRIRRLSPEIYTALTAEVGKGVPGLGQPFSPEGRTTFQDMGAPPIDEPITAGLIRNALAITEHHLKRRKEFSRLLAEEQPPSQADLEAAVRSQFDLVLRRRPTDDELARFLALIERSIASAGREAGVRHALAAVHLLPEAVMRLEVGGGEPDAHGRVRLAPREIAFALAYALTDRRPDGALLLAVDKGELDTDEGVAAAIRRLLADEKLAKPRILRYFREYFGYAQAADLFKEDRENPEHDGRALVEDTDALILHILADDRQVLRQLLTTNKSFVAHRTAADTKKRRADELAKFEQRKRQEPEKYQDKQPPRVGRSIYEAYNLDDFPDEQPVELPASERAGVLTQPAWLVAWSKSDENDAIHRGKWIRERLLGGVVPDVPITVDAQLPTAPEQTLRQRMEVTRQEYCWKCHTLMNRLGLPFEQFDHFGRYRTGERVLDLEATAANVDPKGKPRGPVYAAAPLNATGGIDHTGDAALDGDVADPLALIRTLAASERVEQVFVRHAFRYWLGRNESLGDAATLQAAHAAYRASGGSHNELIVALLSSESFLYRIRSQSSP